VINLKRIQDMRKATLAEFDEEEADWRETAERQVEHFDELADLPTPDELDELDPDEAINQVDSAVENNAQLFVNATADVQSWGEMAIARINVRAKAAKKKAAKAKP
jgi:hypothetical protein